MPPMSFADKLRSMSDEELADFFTVFCGKQRNVIFQMLQAKGIVKDITFVEIPMMAKAKHLKWLREPIKEELK